MQEQLPRVTIYTDGGTAPNPGPGGYGVVVIHGHEKKPLSGGFRRTTNNRMEILAAIVGLESLRTRSDVTIHTDSRYLADAIEKGWARRWRRNSWQRNPDEKALNPDLWERLLLLCESHRVRFVWVKGHSGLIENEWCDHIATQARLQPDLPPDYGYEASQVLGKSASKFSE